MMSPGALTGAPPMVSSVASASAGNAAARVLVGFIVTFQSDPGGSFWPIHSGRTALGRSAAEGIDIALQDASASSRHASVHADPATGQAFVEDDGSRNGTFLNEARLSPGDRRQLRDNDRLRLGSTTFVVKLLVS
jgi:pSer/pThr/pTyr-binding forkhead associated (FHA) protein